MGGAGRRRIERLLSDLGAEERDFVMDWLADHAASVHDDVFLPAALTARLIIEQQRVADRLRHVMRDDLRLLNGERVAIHAEIIKLRAEVAAIRDETGVMRRQRAAWLAVASDGVALAAASAAADIEQRMAAGLARLSAAVNDPIAPIQEIIAKLPDVVRSAASIGAARGAESAWDRSMAALDRWTRARVLTGAVIVALAALAAFYVGRVTAPKIAASAAHPVHHNMWPPGK